MSARAPGPGIAQARRREDAFAAWLKATETDGDALASFGLAYADLPREAREALIEVVVREVEHPLDILAVFLAVEEEPSVAQRLAELMSMRSRRHRAEPEAALREIVAGHEVALIRPLHGSFAEVMRVRCNRGGVIGIEVESLIHLKELQPLARIPLYEALDRVCLPLWRYLRNGGSLPPGAKRFAGLFSLADTEPELG